MGWVAHGRVGARVAAGGGSSGHDVGALIDEIHEELVDGSDHRAQDIAMAVAARVPSVPAPVRAAIVEQVLGRLDGLRDLRRVLADESVTDVLINGPGPVVVERHGSLEVVGRIGAGELDRLVELLLAPTGRRVDRRSPVVDVRIDARTRCHVAVAPVAVGGTCVSLRRFPASGRGLEEFGDPAMVARLRDLVAARHNILVFGPTGSGKTSLLASLLAEVPDQQRIVVVEEAAELPVAGVNVVRLEAQPPNLDGVGGVSLAELVVTSLRMRPDRLVVGEVRGVEAAHFLQAMSTGHRGSMGTVHADSVEGALWRLEQLARSSGMVGDVGSQLRGSLDVAVEMERGLRGARVVRGVHQITQVSR